MNFDSTYLGIKHNLRRPVPPSRHILGEEASVVMIWISYTCQTEVANLLTNVSHELKSTNHKVYLQLYQYKTAIIPIFFISYSAWKWRNKQHYYEVLLMEIYTEQDRFLYPINIYSPLWGHKLNKNIYYYHRARQGNYSTRYIIISSSTYLYKIFIGILSERVPGVFSDIPRKSELYSKQRLRDSVTK